ncbi:MAG: hypothetical protein IT430_10825 [Phycisphaerales bacterium]|nr:hypothetical protein [Phycisphaerales bacterium]
MHRKKQNSNDVTVAAAVYPPVEMAAWRRILILVLALLLARPAAAQRIWVVVHRPELADVAQQWGEFRRATGWQVQDLDADFLAPSDAAPEQFARALQAELRRRFAAARTSGVADGDFAVLLLGPVADADGRPAIPTWHRPQTDADLIGRDGLADIATDLPYQLADDLDDLPDFALGRVPARSADEALAALDKVQRYETQAPGGPWRRRLTYLAGEGGFGAIDALLERLFINMLDQIVPYDFDVNMTYANPRSPYCAPPERFSQVVLDRLSEGALLVNYMGHGQIGMLDRFTIGLNRYDVCSIDSLRQLKGSGNRLPIALLVACWTGRVDLPAERRGLGEMMLFNRNGPVAVIAATRISHPYANALVQKGFTQQLCERRRASVGAAHLAAMRQLAGPDEIDRQLEGLAAPIAVAMKWKSTPGQLRLMHMGMYGLLGDPATRIAYPPTDVVDWKFDAPNARVAGRVAEARGGEAVITIETRRETIPRLSEMRLTAGVGGEVLDAARESNYQLANDKVLWRTAVPLDDAGRFAAALPREVLSNPAAAWIKVYVTATDATGAVADACASARLSPE